MSEQPGEPQITLRILCHTLPGRTFGRFQDVELGIQRGRDSVQTVAGDALEAAFTAVLRVGGDTPAGRPNFLGPFVHGTPDARFTYLSWSGLADGERSMFRRSKILLGGLTREQVEQAMAEGRPLVVRAKMTAPDGGPACGTACEGVEWEV